MQDKKGYIFVVGNEKGGAGKTTTSIHLIVYLLQLGFKVASIDADLRQKSLTRYLENREASSKKNQLSLVMPTHHNLTEAKNENLADKKQAEEESFTKLMDELQSGYDFIVIDTPGSNTIFSSIAHSYADTIITPINDSFVDLDVLAKVNSDSLKVERSAIYSQMIWEQKIRKATREQGSINWLVLRNRMSIVDSKNKRFMTQVLDELAARLGFVHIIGFSERVIYRELFLQGLTLLDLSEENELIALTMSHVAARQELRNFMKALNIEQVNQALKPAKQESEKELIA